MAEKISLERNQIRGQYLYSSLLYAVIVSVAFYYVIEHVLIATIIFLLFFYLFYIFYTKYRYKTIAKGKFKRSNDFYLFTYTCEVIDKKILVYYDSHSLEFPIDEISDYYEDEYRLIILNSFTEYTIINKKNVDFSFIN